MRRQAEASHCCSVLPCTMKKQQPHQRHLSVWVRAKGAEPRTKPQCKHASWSEVMLPALNIAPCRQQGHGMSNCRSLREIMIVQRARDTQVWLSSPQTAALKSSESRKDLLDLLTSTSWISKTKWRNKKKNDSGFWFSGWSIENAVFQTFYRLILSTV